MFDAQLCPLTNFRRSLDPDVVDKPRESSRLPTNLSKLNLTTYRGRVTISTGREQARFGLTVLYGTAMEFEITAGCPIRKKTRNNLEQSCSKSCGSSAERLSHYLLSRSGVHHLFRKKTSLALPHYYSLILCRSRCTLPWFCFVPCWCGTWR